MKASYQAQKKPKVFLKVKPEPEPVPDPKSPARFTILVCSTKTSSRNAKLQISQN